MPILFEGSFGIPVAEGKESLLICLKQFQVAAPGEMADLSFPFIEKLQKRCGVLRMEGEFDKAYQHVDNWRLVENDSDRITVFYAEQTRGFTGIDGDFEKVGGIEQTEGFSNGHLGIGVVDCLDGRVSLDDDRKRAVVDCAVKQVA